MIVCTFNRTAMLRRALRSVLAQAAFDDFEIVVLDDGSDEPVSLEDFPSDRFRLLRTEHQGAGAARAAGLMAARGEFVAYCDDDDEWKPEHLHTLYSYLVEHEEVDLVYGDSEWPSDGKKVCYSYDFDVHHLQQSNFIFATDVMHRCTAGRRR